MEYPTANRFLGERVSRYFRAGRSEFLRDYMKHHSAPGQGLRVLDLGGRYDFWERLGLEFLRSIGAKITILNLSPMEARYTDLHQDLFEYVVGDACNTGYEDDAFDLVVSNSVIEHLGTWDNMIAFSIEAARVGRAYYCQTPNFWFPIDPHFYRMPFFHFLPRPTRAWLLQRFPLATVGRIPGVVNSFRAVDSASLLTREQMKALFPSASLRPERFLGVFVKSYVAVS